MDRGVHLVQLDQRDNPAHKVPWDHKALLDLLDFLDQEVCLAGLAALVQQAPVAQLDNLDQLAGLVIKAFRAQMVSYDISADELEMFFCIEIL